MTSAEKRIREALAREFPDVEVRTPAGAGATLEIPAAHERVGPLHVRIDSDEITVFVGPAHCHFELDDEGPQDGHVAEALQFVREVLFDRMILWSCLGAAGAYPATSAARFRWPWLVRRFVWSGPLPTSRRATS